MQGYTELVNCKTNWRNIGKWIPTSLYVMRACYFPTNLNDFQSLGARMHAWTLNWTLKQGVGLEIKSNEVHHKIIFTNV